MWSSLIVSILLIIRLNFFGAEKIRYISTERPAITFVDGETILWANSTSRRYSRDNPMYFYDLSFEMGKSFSNNISVDFYFFQWLSNQYKRSFVEMHWLFCDLVHKDKFFGTAMRQGKFLQPCPYPVGVYHIYNCTIPVASIPKGFPFTKGRIYANLTVVATKHLVASGYVDMELKEMTVKKKKEKKTFL